MSIFPPSLPEKFSSALQPETLLDLLQIEGMKIEEESEVRWPWSRPLPWVASGPGAGAFGRSTGVCKVGIRGLSSQQRRMTRLVPVEALLVPSPTPAAWPPCSVSLAISSVCGQTGSLQFSVLWVEEAARSSQPGARLR